MFGNFLFLVTIYVQLTIDRVFGVDHAGTKNFRKTDEHYPKSDNNRYRTFLECVVVGGRLTPQIDPFESLNPMNIFSTSDGAPNVVHGGAEK